MRFLHCSDLHLRYLQGTRLRELCNKRVTGALNLVLRRAKSHRDDRWPALVQAAQDLEVDAIFVSGDLINLGMKREFEACAAQLASCGCDFFVVPGNHDIYLSQGEPQAEFETTFSRYLGAPLRAGHAFPYRVDFGELCLFGLNSSIGRPWFLADGQIGEMQLDIFEEGLQKARAEEKTCIVMLHHPVTEEASRPRRDLADREALAQVLQRHGAELVLHGHEHRQLVGSLARPHGAPIAVHGVASATATSEKPDEMAGFTLYEIADGGLRYQRFRCETPTNDRWTRVNSPHEWLKVGTEAQSVDSVHI